MGQIKALTFQVDPSREIHEVEVIVERKFKAHFHFISWDNVNFGISICLSLPNLEIHLPFSFIRIGWSWVTVPDDEVFSYMQVNQYGKEVD